MLETSGTAKPDRRTSPTERQARIVECFERRPYYSTVELSTILHVSAMTVRRDLQELAQMGVLILVHGGARLDQSAVLERDLTARSSEHRPEKEAIGAYAAAMIQPGEAIGVDAGSTALEVARHLKYGSGLTVVTHSLAVMVELARHSEITVLSLGGTLHRTPLLFSGPEVVAALSTLHLSSLILGMSGIDFNLGMTSGDLSDAETKRAMIRAAERVIIVADHTKIGRRFLAKVGPLQSGHILITDDGVSDSAVERLRRIGVEVHTVPVDSLPIELAAALERG
jgi:DeoR/GlpR family transcriptional regulator of sugar metabolism